MRIKVKIRGIVQGVFFRAHIKREADQLSLKGWVRNTDNGEVEAVFEGPKDKIEQMLKSCWKGSPSSRVDRVEKVKSKGTEKLSHFEIRY